VKPISNGAGPIARTPQPNGHFEKLFEKDNEAFIIYDCKTKNGRWSWNTEFFTRDLPRKSRKRLNLFPANGAPVGRKRMSDQVTNKQRGCRRKSSARGCGTFVIDSVVRYAARRIATLLFILVAGLLTVFGYYASSICITVVLAGFLAILFDPVVVTLERRHLPRGLAATGIVLAGMGLIGLLVVRTNDSGVRSLTFG